MHCPSRLPKVFTIHCGDFLSAADETLHQAVAALGMINSLLKCISRQTTPSASGFKQLFLAYRSEGVKSAADTQNPLLPDGGLGSLSDFATESKAESKEVDTSSRSVIVEQDSFCSVGSAGPHPPVHCRETPSEHKLRRA